MLGIALLNKIKVAQYKRILVIFYIIIFAVTANKLIAG